MSGFLDMIGNIGFPIAVSIYLLIRVENKLGELTAAINELREAVILLPRSPNWKAITSLSSFPGNGQPNQQEYL